MEGVLGHIVRRSTQHVDWVGVHQSLRANLEDADPVAKINPIELLPFFFTVLAVILITASIQYTIGSVVASLTMIESPNTTPIVDVVVEESLPAYTDDPDAPVLKDDQLPSVGVADIEVQMQNAPVTASLRSTLRLLRAKAGFFARWRGLHVSIIYHSLHSYGANASMRWTGGSGVMYVLAYIFFAIGFSLLHMTWTHVMISMPSKKPFWRRMVSYKNARPILLPNLVLAVAELATVFLPAIVAQWVYFGPRTIDEVFNSGTVYTIPALIALLTTFFLVAFCLLLPATVTLARIEALLLPEGEETVVPFDREAITAGIDMKQRGANRALFMAAWRSFDYAARIRLLKVYAKMFGMQMFVIVIGSAFMFLELYIIGFDRLASHGRALVNA